MKRVRRISRLCLENAIPVIFTLGVLGLGLIYLGYLLGQNLHLMMLGSLLAMPLLALLALLGGFAALILGLVLTLTPIAMLGFAVHDWLSNGSRASPAQESGEAE